jgi:2-haloacid dehalogenase
MVASPKVGPMAREISALVFDAYGTLFDVHSVTRLAESLFPGKGAALSVAWRFNRVTRGALEWALEHLQLDADEDAVRALTGEYRRLATFPEVAAALASLAKTRPLAILSNGHPDMLEAVVDHNGLRPYLRGGVLSVHEAGVFKPEPSVYRIAEDKLGVPRSMMGFVSSNGWDAAGAKSFGFRAFWVNRGGAPVERLGVRPDEIVRDLAGLAALLA